jgi:hypothetical protein
MYWRLYYPDDTFIDEPIDYGSIKNRRPGAVVLAACQSIMVEGHDIRQPFCKLNLFGDENDGIFYLPIWYRKHSMGITFNTNVVDKNVDVVVFGFAIPKEKTITKEDSRTLVHVPFSVTIFASLDDKTFVNCPPWTVDKTAIEMLVSEKSYI